MNRGFVWSASLHVALFVVFLLGPGPKAFQWDRAEAVAVDLVSMPAVEIPRPQPSSREPEPKPASPEPEPERVQDPPKEPPADPEPVKPARTRPTPKRVFKRYVPPRSEERPSLAERLASRLAEQPETEAAPAPEETQEAPAPAAPSATAEVEAVNFPYEWYLNVLRTKITAAWDPPGERILAGRDRHVVVRFRVHREGKISDVRVEGGSGTPGLDASAHAAIERGGPYPPLPPEYEGEWLDLGVRFTVTEGGLE